MVQGGAGSTGATKTGNNERFAREWNSYIKIFFDRLYDQYKKPYKVASTAAMRKFLILANSLVRDGRVFTEEYIPKSA
ncbi:hypothetical protein [Wolbachia endosymbiont (group E) of Neria commutata]|uniref:hypothetical protein n=1 Tax=Wolbachia endosymbiont (group E) of Neria commutata TaxID=3066149 RepID=UPI00313318AF